MITYFQAIILGLLQGITELFPISSLGHSVVVPWIFNWDGILSSESSREGFYLAFLVALHVATGIALLIFYRKIWWRITKGFFSSIGARKINSPDARLAWLLLAATVPAGIIGLTFERYLRTQFAKPLSAIVFLFINGCILVIGDRYLKRSSQSQSIGFQDTTRNVSNKLTLQRAGIIGVAQIGALFAGISRSGITMVSGLYSGLNHEDAARFSFLLATPIIFGAGLLKLPDFFSGLDTGVRGPIIAGSIVSGLAAYAAVRFLDKYFRDKTLRPFGLYCIGFSLAMVGLGLIRGGF
jgi:undecaprenyl-diphosphatase